MDVAAEQALCFFCSIRITPLRLIDGACEDGETTHTHTHVCPADAPEPAMVGAGCKTWGRRVRLGFAVSCFWAFSRRKARAWGFRSEIVHYAGTGQ